MGFVFIDTLACQVLPGSASWPVHFISKLCIQSSRQSVQSALTTLLETPDMYKVVLSLVTCLLITTGDGSSSSCDPDIASETFNDLFRGIAPITDPTVLDELCHNKSQIENCDPNIFRCNFYEDFPEYCPIHALHAFKVFDYLCSSDGTIGKGRL
ncbi:hypothetical protein ElyMa_001764000 [Elysia marginata]|uniref:Chitin-binding type-2 domain-containing protein n=1 Tax=Elysia marginata TaxID=1093978 RepID=A0AAV4EBU1_9GAST|nr:hypothetical protein ElyMa_001764000 [Elysia marginata]